VKHLAPKLKNGILKIVFTPLPQMNHKSIMVRNHYSLISAGKEGSSVNTARERFIDKAMESPQQVRQVPRCTSIPGGGADI
jgi:hypothetical protein